MKNSRKESASPEITRKENSSIDYSEVYRKKELAQLQKRLKKTRNILFICACAILGGGLLFWIMPETQFYSRNILLYAALAGSFILLGLLSKAKPYKSLLAGLGICLAFWAIEILRGTSDDILIGGSVQKLIIVSLLISGLHASKEAELIKKELHFS
jgi:ABC-type uncharacterized transport system permease subunit